MVPLWSYIFLRGRCRYCGVHIPARYVIIEVLTACLFLFCFMELGFTPKLFSLLIFVSFLIVISFIDIEHQLILDNVLIWFAGIGAAANVWMGVPGVADMIGAGALGGGLILLIAAASRGGMGDGDIKLAAVLGLWLGWEMTVLALVSAFAIGGIVALGVLLLKMKDRKDFIPFGPFLAVGAFISKMYGTHIIAWYLSIFM